ncbi:hypothetical protein PoB_002804400 [Plakobranchus ocellatus]|uniref:Ig-like domain-containing protein n=1 Tax=Plakobranchus ocellatus TaxID=259542 RepID=A0AAV4A4L6_9GAST|nr:hypothetical protein PoB_002804400 [Plakobranchus ocellatus]
MVSVAFAGAFTRLLKHRLSHHRVKPDCKPAEEGQETTLTCTVNTDCDNNSIVLGWRVNKRRHVIRCSPYKCSSGHSRRYGFLATTDYSGSTLTIPNVSRTDPFNMETRWTCRPCTNKTREVVACDYLEVYGESSLSVELVDGNC